ncbi:hypothetical protein C1X35_09890 [Pseudomonas sp. FW306-1C-G01A]|nr:hypothetical protein [Pseudomonas sp.]MSU97164.1 hypothetical protein [Pseudomonas mandelii]PMV86517.1 hypothetical protein C1X56_14465 [Pseudomonas sp. GW101-1A09]PMV96317.1 hypothetical protein C1X51_07685 [Pseudomonas sp. FW306-2-2C-B10A]PMV97987.1 hypothetical protein C1X55_15635 [Pseudomonas sp. GW460-C8]PMW05012.1 hypothetical protein C1X50_14760 [Pseudomonas sp. MPR-TSA4]PMW18054.1 hypothetical protein C1X53_21890 [Pseudomonas sp. GW456-E6]PMW22310.1 hypothetical protein C1X40_0835
MQASLMPIFCSVSVADRVKSSSKTGMIPVAEAVSETNRLLMAQVVEMFKVGLPYFHSLVKC